MKHIYIFKLITFLVGGASVIVNSIDIGYAYFFNKPLFVHFYPIKKRLSRQQKDFLKENISFYKDLSDKHKSYFEHRLAIFMREYDFIGRENFDITPEVKVLIACSYVKLTFGMRRHVTSVFNKIVIYPGTFYSMITKQYHKGEFNPGFKMIVFSWEDFLLGDVITNDNLNLGIHEFTHALTFHGKKSKDISASIFFKAYKQISIFLDDEKNLTKIKKSNYFREYALTNKLEFVAVIMEHFFEIPQDLQQQFPLLYNKIERMLNYKSISN
ncbi:hypothetical protein C7447_1011037 [Tenacibaculum adriaticum]|uniref:Zinc-dependent peptidase n=1 Tax=Tenacibaculum adriaticum TaxID=413713 RepID=A0A5S5E097_9FLAO|nr:zinc-dependent peptidase [Tenacibaculum adriaticum]TYQ00423.1 hypothetical protein C7447_1011037 [Tenacibaculum adriaticum]